MGCFPRYDLKGWEEAVVQPHGSGTPSGCNDGGFGFPAALPQAMAFRPFRQIAPLGGIAVRGCPPYGPPYGALDARIESERTFDNCYSPFVLGVRLTSGCQRFEARKDGDNALDTVPLHVSSFGFRDLEGRKALLVLLGRTKDQADEDQSIGTQDEKGRKTPGQIGGPLVGH